MPKYIFSKKQISLLENTNSTMVADKLLSSIIKRKYPYIIGIEIEEKDYYTTLARVNVYVDLNKFYQITNTEPPLDYLENDYLLDLLEEPSSYLMSFVDEKYGNSFNNEFNDQLEENLSKIYTTLPRHIVHTKFENVPDEYSISKKISRDFLEKWKSELEPVELRIKRFIPKVDLEKLKIKN